MSQETFVTAIVVWVGLMLGIIWGVSQTTKGKESIAAAVKRIRGY